MVWQLQEAKQKLSQLIKQAQEQGSADRYASR